MFLFDGPILPHGFNTFRRAPAAEVGFEDYIFNPNLSFIPTSAVGPGLLSRNTPPGPGNVGVLAINKAIDSGLPGILAPSFKPQPLSAQYPTG